MLSIDEPLIFQTIVTVGSLVILGRLIQLRMDESKRDALLKKYKREARSNEIYSRVYGSRFLIVWCLLAFTFVLNLAFDIYKQVHKSGLFPFQVTILVLSLTFSVIMLYLLYDIFGK